MSELSVGLATPGPARPGFMRIDWTWNPFPPYDGSTAANLIVGPWFSSSNLMLIGGYCCSILFPAELSQSFSFDTSASIVAYALVFDGSSGGFNNASATIQFYEADGSTPVRIDEAAILTSVPEPTCWPLLGIACIGVLVNSRHRRS